MSRGAKIALYVVGGLVVGGLVVGGVAGYLIPRDQLDTEPGDDE